MRLLIALAVCALAGRTLASDDTSDVVALVCCAARSPHPCSDCDVHLCSLQETAVYPMEFVVEHSFDGRTFTSLYVNINMLWPNTMSVRGKIVRKSGGSFHGKVEASFGKGFAATAQV
jgi:hypothetical protein